MEAVPKRLYSFFRWMNALKPPVPGAWLYFLLLELPVFIHRNRHHIGHSGRCCFGVILEIYVLVHKKDVLHFLLKLRIATLEVALDLVGLQSLCLQYPMDGGLRYSVQTGMTRIGSIFTFVFCKFTLRPYLGSISEFLRFSVGQVDHPGFGLFCDNWFFRRIRHVLKVMLWPCSVGLVYTLVDRRPAYTQALSDGHNAFSLRVSKNDCCTFHLSDR